MIVRRRSAVPARAGRRKLTTAGVVAVVVASILPALLVTGDAGADVLPTKLAFSTQPGDGTPGTALTAQPKVVTTDDSGTTVPSNAPIQLTLTGPGGAALSRVAALSCTASLVTASGGSAAFAACAVSKGGVFSLTATDDREHLTAVSHDFFVSGPAQLLVSKQPGGGVAGGVWAAQPEITVADGHGDPVATSSAHVVLGISAGTGTAGGVLTCTAKDVAATAGVARYAGCGIDRSGAGYRLVAIDATDALISAPSQTFSVTAGTPSQLSFQRPPAGAVGGAAFVTQPTVVVQDGKGNTAVGNTDTVSLAIKAGTGTTGAQLTCTDKPAADGVAGFAGCSIDRAGTGYVLVATDSTANLQVESPAFAVSAGGATGLSFTTQPGGGPGGAAFGTQPVVRIADAGGNAVPGSVTLALVPGTGTAGATLACAANPAAAADGSATFAGCAVTATGTGYRLRATSGSLSVDSVAFDVSAGTPAVATFTTQPGAGRGGSALGTQPVVALTDSGGNSAAGPVTLAIAKGTGTPGATLSCGANPASTTAGTATFGSCSIDRAGQGYRLQATSGTARRYSEPFDVTVGAAAKLAFTVAPGGGTGGTAWTAQPTVAVQDAGGNLVRGSTATIALAVTAGSGAGTLSCTANSLPAVRGSAHYDGCAVDRTASRYRLTATDAADGLSVTSGTFAVVAGAPAALVFSGQPGSGNAGAALTAQPAVTVVDRGGNPAASAVDVTLTTTPGTGAGAALSCIPRTRTAAPRATYTKCSLPTAGSGYTLTATAGALHAESSPFPVLLAAPAPLGAAPTGVPAAQTLGGRDYGVNPTDVVDDVNTATGSLTFASDDLTVAGIGLPLELTRTYNSADATGGAFGPGWSSILDLGVTIAADGSTATVRGEDGQRLVFRSQGLGGLLGWAAPAGARSSLSCLLLSCTVQRFDGRSFTVSGGHVVAYRAATGQGLSFAWTANSVRITVATTASKPLVVVATLDSTGRVTKIASPTRSVSYAYAGGLLSSVTDVRGRTWSYGYTAARLTGVTDPAGVVRQTATYDAAGRVVATTRQGSAQLVDDTFTWSAGRATRSALTDVQGVLRRVDSTDLYAGNVLVQQTDPIGATQRFSYDTALNLVQTQDPMGWVRQLSYNATGDLVRVADPISSTSSAVVTMTYDAAHRLLTQTDPNGNTTTLTYLGNVLATVRAPGVSPGTIYDYDLIGQQLRMRTGTGYEVYSHDAAGNVTGTQLQDTNGATLNGRGTLVTYDEAGHKLTSVDPRGNLAKGVDPTYASTWTYDAAGHQLTQTLPGPVTTTTTYDAAGDLASATDAKGTTTYSWNQSARAMTIAGPSGTTVQTYDPSGHLLTQADATSHRATTHTYDAAGRELATTDPSGVTVNYSFDIEGNVVHATNTEGAEIIRQFDSLNRPVREVLDGVESRTGWDAAGNVVSTTQNGVVTRTTYNSHNQVATVKTATGTTKYGYDLASDELRSTTDAMGNVTSYTYDAAQRRITATVDGGTTRYGYDLAGNPATTTDADGRTTTTTFNALNLAAKTVSTQAGQPAVTVETGYDAAGRRTRMVDASGTHDYGYDADGNLVSAAGPAGTFRYDYGTPGTITETYPDGTKIAYGIDDSQHLMSVQTGTPGTPGYVQASYVRDAARQTTALAYSNGVLETRSYDRTGNVVDQQLRNASGALADDTFSYDAAGNRLTQRDTVGGTTTANRYGYDATGRLTTFTTASGAGTLTGATVPAPTTTAAAPDDDADATISGGADVTPAFGVSTAVDPATAGAKTSYNLDAVGNRLSTTAPAGVTKSTYDSADRITAQRGVGATTWSYDNSGHVTRMGAQRFTYDAAGRLATVTNGTSTVSYTYDGDGNRITRTAGDTVTRYVWDVAGELPQLALELTGSGDLIRRYIYGDGPVAEQTPTATYLYHLDPVGSVAELSDAHGAIVAQYHYDAFGRLTTTGPTPPANPLLFQGQYLDTDTGLYNMRARQYDPNTGRFTQRDPQERAVGTPSESTYVFAANRPTVFTDPTGRTPTVASTFMGHANTETNVAANTKLGLSALGVGVKAVSKLGGYSAAVVQAERAAVSAEVAAAAQTGKALSKFGTGLAVVGIALQVFITVEDCLTKDAYTCAGGVVGTAVGIGFTVGCAVLTVGAGAAACAIAGAVLSIALQEVITRFGPDIVAGVVAGAGIVAQGVVDGAGIVARAAVDYANQVSTFAVEAGGAIVSGFNSATAAISSGFDTAISTLTDAGYAAVQLADVLAHAFDQGLDQAVAALVGLGYDIADIATSALGVFTATATQIAGVLKNGLDFAADQISGALQSAYGTLAAQAGAILAGVGFAVDQVAGALKSTYQLAADATAAVLDGVGYAYDQVAGALDAVFTQTDQAVASILAGIGATANDVGAALRDFYDDADAATAAALAYATYTAGQVAGALQSAYDSTVQAVAGLLQDVQFGATQIAGALKSVYAVVDVQVAQLLHTLAYGVLDVAGALQDAYGEAAQAVSSALRTVGYTVVEVGTALSQTFSLAAAGAAALLQTIGYDVGAVGLALKSAFSQTADQVVSTLSGVGYQIADVATVLASAFLLGAADAAAVLDQVFTSQLNAVALALAGVFAQSAEQVVGIFKNLGKTTDQLAGVLKSAFGQAGAAAAQLLKNIGVTAASIASALQSVFGQAVSDVANLLKSIGFSNDTINAIGGAFEDFGKAVADCFSSFFTDC